MVVSSPRGFPLLSDKPLRVLADLTLAPARMAHVQELVDYVRGREPPGVEDRRDAPVVVCHHAHEAVADAAGLVTDGELGDALSGHLIGVQPQAIPPALDSVVVASAANANHSQYVHRSKGRRRYPVPSKRWDPPSLDVEPGPPGRISSTASPT
jgi:hypothetical protein